MVSYFRFDIGKANFGGAQNENGSKSRIRNQLLLEGSRVALSLMYGYVHSEQHVSLLKAVVDKKF